MNARTAPTPRPRSLSWAIGDLVVVGSTRWVIRNIVGDHVEFEATNVSAAGIWWTTTLDRLPDKEQR